MTKIPEHMFWAFTHSFSNAHAFLFLNQGGALTKILFCGDANVNDLSAVTNSFYIISGAQVIFGPILLFFLLLTLRNRVRLG